MPRRESEQQQDREAHPASHSERAREDRALIESELRYRRLFETACEGILIVDAQSTAVIDANPSFFRLLGYSRAEIEGKRLADPAAFAARLGQRLAAAAAQAVMGTSREELTLTAKNGRSVEIELTASSYPIGERRVVQLDLRDVSERHNAKRELLGSLARYRDTLDNLLEGCQIIDFSWRYLYVNRAAARHGRRTTAALLNRTLMESYPGIESTRFYWAVWSCMNDRIHQRVESEFVYPDGSVGCFEVLAQPVPEGVFVLSIDITERKQREALAARLAAIVNSSDEAITGANLQGEFTSWNDGAQRLYGYSREEAIGKPVSLLIPPDRCDELPAILASIRAGETLRPYETARRKKDGGEVEVLLTVSSVKDDRGAVIGASAIARDIGDRKQAEHEMTRRLAELEAVNKISTTLRAAQTVEEMLPVLLDVTLEVLEAEDGAIWLHDAARDELRVEISRGYGEREGFPPPPPERVGAGLSGLVFASGKTDIARDIRNDPRIPEHIRRNIPPGVDQVAVPIRAGEAVIGVFSVSFAPPRELTPTVVHLLSTLSEIAGNAIHRTRLHEQTVRRLRHLSALRKVDIAITTVSDLHVTLEAVLVQVTDALEVDAADVLLLNPVTHLLQYSAGNGFRCSAIESSMVRLGEANAWRAVLDRDTVQVDDLHTDPGFARTPLVEAERFVTAYFVPLITKGQAKGVLEIFHRSRLDPDREWLDFLVALAGQTAIAIENATLFASLQRSSEELVMAYDATIEGWSHALDLRDRETEGHTRRVTEMTLALAKAYGLGDDDLTQIRWGALLHDIGKMGVPDSILHKPGPLTEDEWVVMRRHPTLAHEMLAPIRYLQNALDIPYCHHEKWDGSGYPRGLAGEQIPVAARLFAVVDVWDALRSDRPYRKGWSEEEVKSHLARLSGSHFDPRVLALFLETFATPAEGQG